EIQSALEQSMADNFKPTLAIVFISIKQDRKAICEILHQQGIDIIGATSSGEFINGHQSEGETVLMLFDIDKNDYCILFEDIGKRGLSEAAEQMTKAALQKFNKPVFILCSTSLTADGKMLEGETLIHSMEKVAGPESNIFGGMAGDDISFTGTYVFTNDQSTSYGMAALVLNGDRISLYGMAISGWKPIGISRTVTRSENNLVYTIDNKPALEMYLRFLGSDIDSADDQIKFFESLGSHYPFQIERENREPMMCNPMGYDKEKGALICESNVAQGARFRFSTPPDFDIVETVVEKARSVKKEVNTDADALLIFSCTGRLAALGPMAQQENEGLAEVWNAPMAGFYTYGEYGRAINGKHEFHSTTCSWVALKEK
ncbi:MAG: FIST C-terminal domain-containing protein, partial [Bacteroidia bacterium]|nr:FIST C-terminal domain-containing protein [Bacteroidia bacterium]